MLWSMFFILILLVGYGLQKWYKEIRESQRAILALLRLILKFLYDVAHQPTSIHIRFGGGTMPATFVVGQTIPATATETDAAGLIVPIPNPATLSWTSSDPTIASVTTNADGSATFTAIAVGSITAQVTDAANGLTTSDTLTVVAAPDVPTAIAITWGTPQ